jgi:hypothetical protein
MKKTVLLIGCLVLAARAVADGPVERFLAGLEADASVPADARELIRASWAKCDGCDAEEFLTQGLAVVSEKFRAGLDAYDADDYGRCAALMGELRDDTSLSVAVSAAVYEIKSLVNLDRLVEAGRMIDALSRRGDGIVAAYSFFEAEVEFLRGYCLVADLQYEAAEGILAQFLADHPDASQRLRLAARQMLVELANRQPGRIGEVVDLMGFCERRLQHADSGSAVQTRQARVIELLDRLIEQAEQSEQASTGGSGSGGNSESPKNPMQESQLPGGRPPESPLGPQRRANPGEAWGDMPPAERERILQALRESFPSRYRQLVEQYYEQLAREP